MGIQVGREADSAADLSAEGQEGAEGGGKSTGGASCPQAGWHFPCKLSTGRVALSLQAVHRQAGGETNWRGWLESGVWGREGKGKGLRAPTGSEDGALLDIRPGAVSNTKPRRSRGAGRWEEWE